MKKDCKICRDKFSQNTVGEFKNWIVHLFSNQYYPGRCLIKLKKHKVDLTELNKDEREELFEKVLPKVQGAIDDIFGPDLYNQATLGNDCRHFHLHVIPRYKDKREFNGEVFRDQNWNSNYTPYPGDFEIKDETYRKLQDQIREKLQ